MYVRVRIGWRRSNRSVVITLYMPTVEQLKTLFILSFWATKMYLPVFLVRIDERTKNIVILAGEETEIIIYPNGKWRYI